MEVGDKVLGGVVGGLFAGHGAQKLFGAFGGHGLEGTGQFFESMGMFPGKNAAAAAGAAELGGGAMVATGIGTPAGAAALTATMVTAIRKVHAANGLWATDNGFEYNLVLIASLFEVTDRRHGTAWAIGELVAGVAGSVGMMALTERGGRGQETAPDDAASADGQRETELADAPA
jgi:putative oxidoreductase